MKYINFSIKKVKFTEKWDELPKMDFKIKSEYIINEFLLFNLIENFNKKIIR